MSIEEKIVQLVNRIGNGLPSEYGSINLFDSDVLDSLGVMQMIPELDDLFDIEIDVDDVIESNFDSIDHIVNMVEKYIK